MPFENIKRQVDQQKAAADATLKHNQWLREQERLKALADQTQKDTLQAQQEQKWSQLKECFDASGINVLTDELVNIVPGMQKHLRRNHSKWNGRSEHGETTVEIPRAQIKKGLINGILNKTELKIDHVTAYEGINLSWGGYSNDRGTGHYEIEIGFLADKSLAIQSQPVVGLTVLQESEWRNNQPAIEKALEKAFLHPDGPFTPNESPSYSTEVFYDGR